MYHHEDARLLAEIEFYLALSDPEFAARMRRRARPRQRLARWLVGRVRAARSAFVNSGTRKEPA